ncbi:MAG: immune inhibitor A [Chloroflexi bacterium]|nr:immune inhibitor A [Chloroflexota bacterium]
MTAPGHPPSAPMREGSGVAARVRGVRALALGLAALLAAVGCSEPPVVGPALGDRPASRPVAVAPPDATVVLPAVVRLARGRLSVESPTAADLAAATAQRLADTARPARDLYALAAELRLNGAAVPREARPEPVGYRLGERDTFWIADQVRHGYFQTSARLVLVTPNVYWWLEDGHAVSMPALERSAERFEAHIYPTVRRYFGEEWRPGTDGDPRLSVFLGRLPGVAGYFSSADEYPAAVNPHSNERELIYLNVGVMPPGTTRFEATLAHEFQHMVHWWQRRADDTWLNEGAAELASWLAGYPTDAARAFLNRPATQLTAWAQLEEGPVVSAHYGAAYLFMHYLWEQHGTANGLRDFLALPETGVAAVDAYLSRLGAQRRFDDLFADWIVANLLDADVTGDGRFVYRDRDVRIERLEPALLGRWQSVQTPQYAARYVDLPTNRGDLRLRLEASDVAALLPTSAPSGVALWWSNRGDEMATRLTRALDLRGLTQATLAFWTWFDIEKDYDYAYVMASVDGGQTWTTLPGQHTTTSDPNGASYGHGYTGRSGGGKQAVWVREHVDLTPYAGQEVLLRFALVTDDAYNAPGYAVDDVEVPEVGFADDAEADEPGWTVDGFVRGAPLVPQRFVARLVVERDSVAVEDLAVEGGRLDALLPVGGARRAVLVLAPLAPVTTEPAPYRYFVEPAR